MTPLLLNGGILQNDFVYKNVYILLIVEYFYETFFYNLVIDNVKRDKMYQLDYILHMFVKLAKKPLNNIK